MSSPVCSCSPPGAPGQHPRPADRARLCPRISDSHPGYSGTFIKHIFKLLSPDFGCRLRLRLNHIYVIFWCVCECNVKCIFDQAFVCICIVGKTSSLSLRGVRSSRRGYLFYLHILPGRHEGPCPHVPLLLLGPDEGLGIAV